MGLSKCSGVRIRMRRQGNKTEEQFVGGFVLHNTYYLPIQRQKRTGNPVVHGLCGEKTPLHEFLATVVGGEDLKMVVYGEDGVRREVAPYNGEAMSRELWLLLHTVVPSWALAIGHAVEQEARRDV